MRYQQTAIQIYNAPDGTWNVTLAEIRGLAISAAGFVVFVAIFAFVAFGDSLSAP